MKKADLIYIVGSVGIAFTSLLYCATIGFSLKVPRYYPLEHTWKWVNEKGVPSQGWYGMQIFAFLGAGLLCALLYLALKRIPPSTATLRPAATKQIAWVTLIIVCSCLGYLLYHEFHKWHVFDWLFST